MIRDQKSLYRLFALTLSILITVGLINHQTSKYLLLKKNPHFHQTARLTLRSTTAISENDHQPISLIDYSKIYYAQSTRNMRALVILSLVLWLSFLFSFVGIVASDFFCPNLSTISLRLGLSENLAGVTLLGFGNGAPDVFSTFAAIKADTGSLAIGELIGATSFIISVVVGSMSIIRPFKVPRHSFLRDLGFFIVAIVFVLIIIKEGVIHRWQANALVLLYLIYVAAVLLSTWSVGRKRIKLDQLQIARSEYNHDDQLIQPYLDDPDFPIQPNSLDANPLIPELNQGVISFNSSTRSSPQLGPPSNQSRSPSLRIETSSSLKSQDSFKSLLETSCYPMPLPVRQRRMRAPSLSYRADNPRTPINFLGPSSPSNGNGPTHPVPHPSPPQPLANASQDLIASPEAPRRRRRNTVVMNPIRPSLLGAIEFRDVVNSLARDSVSHPIPRLSGYMSPQFSYSTSQGRRSRSGSIAVIPRNISSPIAPPRRHPCPIRSDSDWPARKTEFVLPPVNTSLPGRTTSRHRLTQSQSSILPTTPRPWESAKQPSPRMDNEVNPADNEESIIELPSMDQDNLLPDRADDGPPSVYPTDQTRRPSSQAPMSSIQHPAAPLPSILITSDRQEILTLPDSPDQDGEIPSARSLPPNLERARRRHRWRVLISVIWETLFPTLKDWRIKSLLGKAVAIVSAPAVLVLTLTLPVVDETEEDSIEELQDYEEQDDHEDEIGDALIALDEERTVGLGVNKDPETEEAEEDNELVSVPPGCTDRDSNSRRSRAQKTYRQRLSEEEEHQEDGGGKAVSYPMVDVGENHATKHVSRDSLTKSTLMGRCVDEGRSAESHQQEEGETFLSEAEMESEEGESENEWLIAEAERACYSGQHIARILATVQTFLAPTFWLVCLVDSPSEETGEGTVMVEVGGVRMARGTGTAIAGLLLGGFLARLVYRHLGPGHEGKVVKITLCFLGFLNSMVWILNIVNEVIQILTTFGSIFHLSNAILGLTIFGIGNSLGDFVANVTLAKMGFPVMAMSACFGGPLLNILLGIGLSSSLVMTTRGVERISLESSKSLLVPTSALLAVLLLMLVLVPIYKHFTFDKHTGILLILAYGAVFSLNLLVEIFL